MSGKPLSRMVEVQDVLAAQAEGRETSGHASLLLLLRLVGARHADDLETDDAARKMAPAIGAADTGVDSGGKQRVTSLEGRGRGCGDSLGAQVAGVCERGLGVAEYATQGDLARWRLEAGGAVPLGALGRLDVELSTLEEELVALEVSAIGVAPSTTADVVDVPGGANGEDERCSLDVVEFLNVAGKNVHHGLRDAGEHDALDVSVRYGLGDLLLQPRSELVIVKVTDCDIGTIR